MRKILIVCLSLFWISSIHAQKRMSVPKYTFEAVLAKGVTFPTIASSQTDWQAKWHSAFVFDLGTSTRITRRLSWGLNLGFTAFFMEYRGKNEDYLLDFGSLTAQTNLAFHIPLKNAKEGVFRTHLGAQMGYNDIWTEQLNTFYVEASSTNNTYFFTRVDLGKRNFFKTKFKGIKTILSYEWGIFGRYNFNGLGTALFIETDQTTIIKPRGHIVGLYFKFSSPIGNKISRVPTKSGREKPFPPIIYNPRW